MITALAMMFAIMTSYTRARAESLITKCKVGFMERPERIVLFMIGAFTNRMAAVMWVIGVLSVFTVADRIIYTYRELQTPSAEGGRMKNPATLPARVLWNAFFWTYERATWQYDLMVIAILAFVWLTPPDWLHDPTASGAGPIGWLQVGARAIGRSAISRIGTRDQGLGFVNALPQLLFVLGVGFLVADVRLFLQYPRTFAGCGRRRCSPGRAAGRLSTVFSWCSARP